MLPTFLKSIVICSTVLAMMNAVIGNAQANSLAESLKPKKLILSIGISNFDDEIWTDLRYASKDAKDFYQFFMNKAAPYHGGQNLGGQTKVTKTQVLDALKRLESANHNEEDTVVLYLSTHGSLAYRPDGSVGRYIITSDTDSQNVANTALDYDVIVNRFKALKSRKKVLVLAFCHSGVGKSALTPTMKKSLAMIKAPFFAEPVTEKSEGTIILTASGWREPAMEDSALQNDVYTHFLLKGFLQDQNEDGVITIMEAHSYAVNETYKFTSGKQRPSAIVELLGSDPIVISGQKNSTSTASLYSFMNNFQNLIVKVDNKQMGSIEKGVNIPEGKVRLTLVDPKKNRILLDRVMRFEGGKEYSVANLLVPRFVHSLSVGPSAFQSYSPNFNKSYAPKTTIGYSIAYSQIDFWKIYSLHIDMDYHASTPETIDVEDNVRFEQRRTMILAGVSLGIHEYLKALSNSDGSRRVELYATAGLKTLWIKRDIAEESFETKSSSDAFPGGYIKTGIEFTFPYYLLKLNLETQLNSIKGVIDDENQFLTASQTSIKLGTFW
jgi:hypothetical protein